MQMVRVGKYATLLQTVRRSKGTFREIKEGTLQLNKEKITILRRMNLYKNCNKRARNVKFILAIIAASAVYVRR